MLCIDSVCISLPACLPACLSPDGISQSVRASNTAPHRTAIHHMGGLGWLGSHAFTMHASCGGGCALSPIRRIGGALGHYECWSDALAVRSLDEER